MERTKFNIKGKEPPEGGFGIVFWYLTRRYEPNIVIFWTYLIDKYRYYSKHNLLLDGEWFFIRWKDVQRDISLTPYKARSCKELLEREGFIETRMMTHPQKQYYRINWESALNHQSSNYLTNNRQITLRYNNTIDNSIKIYSLGKLGFPKDWEENKLLQSTIEKWLVWRQEKGFPNDLPLIKKLVKVLIGLGSIETAIKSIERSIKKGWKSIQPLPVKRTPKCPLGWRFGIDYSDKYGCQETCQEDHNKTFIKCQKEFSSNKRKTS